MTLPGVILAGGQASRVGGGDKGKLVLAGRTLFDHVIDQIGTQVDCLAINANGPQERLVEFGLPVLPDTVPTGAGELAGVLVALDWAAHLGAAQVVTVPSDMPFLPGDLVVRLQRGARATNKAMALAACHDQGQGQLVRHPTCSLWSVSLRAELRALLELGNADIFSWADSHGMASILFPSSALFNIDTVGDLSAAEARLQS